MWHLVIGEIQHVNKVNQAFFEFALGEKNSEFVDKAINSFSDSDSGTSDWNCESSKDEYWLIECIFTVCFN